MNLDILTNEDLIQKMTVVKGTNLGRFNRFRKKVAKKVRKKIRNVQENHPCMKAYHDMSAKLDTIISTQEKILNIVKTTPKPSAQITEAKQEATEEKKRYMGGKGADRMAFLRKIGRDKLSKLPSWMKNRRPDLKAQPKYTWLEKASEKEKKENYATKGIGFVSGIYEDFFASLPEANWIGTFGGMPQVPGYPSVPKLCPRSIYTNLQRLFFSGVNLMAEIQRLSQQSNPETVRNYLKGKKAEWRNWLQGVMNYHGKTPDKQKLINSIWSILSHVFDLPTDEFLEKWAKIAYNAYRPNQFEGYVKRFFR